MQNIVEALHDLHKQATTENSHYYTAAVISRAIVAITKMQTAIKSECHRLEHDWNAADVTAARRNLTVSMKE